MPEDVILARVEREAYERILRQPWRALMLKASKQKELSAADERIFDDFPEVRDEWVMIFRELIIAMEIEGLYIVCESEIDGG